MRFSNRNKSSYYSFLNTLFLIMFLGGIAVFFIDKYKFHILGWMNYLAIILPAFMFFLFYMSGRQIFEYDSDGEALNFKNRNIIPFLDKSARDEFPKYKLLKYEIVSYPFYRRLYITISSKNTHTSILKYDITYLNIKEVKNLKISLNKVVKKNNENQT